MGIFEKVKKFIKTEDIERTPEKKEEAEAVPKEVGHPPERKPQKVFPGKGRGELSWVLVAPHISEKASQLAAVNQHVFRVSPRANVHEIKQAVEAQYGVHVMRISVISIPSKERRLRGRRGVRPGYRKAVVRVKKGEKIAALV